MADIKDILGSVKMEGGIPVYYIYGDITSSIYDSWEDDTCPAFIRNFIDKNKGREIHIHINSPGGSVFAGVAIYNMLKAREGKTVIYVDALAASAASVIALAGDEIYMPKGSMLMIHEPWTLCAGNSRELRAQADALDKIRESIIDIYSECSGQDTEYIYDLIVAETWLTAEESAALFDRVQIDESMKACACIRGKSLDIYDDVPKELKFEQENSTKTEKTEDNGAENERLAAEIDAVIAKIEVEEMLK